MLELALLGSVTALYALSGLIDVIGFAPQIWRLLTCQSRAQAISFTAYWVWFSMALVGWLYSAVVLRDGMASWVNAGFALGNGSVILLAFYKRFMQPCVADTAGTNTLPAAPKPFAEWAWHTGGTAGPRAHTHKNRAEKSLKHHRPAHSRAASCRRPQSPRVTPV